MLMDLHMFGLVATGHEFRKTSSYAPAKYCLGSAALAATPFTNMIGKPGAAFNANVGRDLVQINRLTSTPCWNRIKALEAVGIG